MASATPRTPLADKDANAGGVYSVHRPFRLDISHPALKKIDISGTTVRLWKCKTSDGNLVLHATYDISSLVKGNPNAGQEENQPHEPAPALYNDSESAKTHNTKRKAEDGSVEAGSRDMNRVIEISNVSATPAAVPAKKQKVAAPDQAKPSKDAIIDVSHIHLDGEEDDDVPILDTPGTIRRKISNHFRKTNVTQAAFLRTIWNELKGPRKTGRVFQSKQLTDFRRYKGPTQGNTGTIFYAAYVYFEKLRIAKGERETDERLEMEVQWPGGMDTDRPLDRGYFIVSSDSKGSRSYLDQYGKIRRGR